MVAHEKDIFPFEVFGEMFPVFRFEYERNGKKKWSVSELRSLLSFTNIRFNRNLPLSCVTCTPNMNLCVMKVIDVDGPWNNNAIKFTHHHMVFDYIRTFEMSTQHKEINAAYKMVDLRRMDGEMANHVNVSSPKHNRLAFILLKIMRCYCFFLLFIIVNVLWF